MDQQKEKKLLNDEQLEKVTGGTDNALQDMNLATKREIVGKEGLIEAKKVFYADSVIEKMNISDRHNSLILK